VLPGDELESTAEDAESAEEIPDLDN
jgi:hypothetical protein